MFILCLAVGFTAALAKELTLHLRCLFVSGYSGIMYPQICLRFLCKHNRLCQGKQK